jgi:hypothetical protein
MSGDSKLKTSWDDHYMFPAYVGFLSFALGNGDILAQYRAETGDNWTPAKTPIEQMVDEATGAELRFLQSFSDFCERAHFGTPADIDGHDPDNDNFRKVPVLGKINI